MRLPSPAHSESYSPRARGAPAPQARADEPILIHTPPLKQLDLRQLKALSIECEKYLPGQFARGPYDAAYCQAAIDAWGDAPLQIVRIPASPQAQSK